MGLASVASAIPSSLMAAFESENAIAVRDFEKPMFDIPGQIPGQVIIESIEILRVNGVHFVRTRSVDGAEGLTPTKQLADFIPIFEKLVAPYFIGKDARDIEELVDGIYRAQYKLAGLPFWCPVAYIEQSILDMLGKIVGKPIGALLGGVLRDEIPIYLSGSDRVLSAREEVDIYVRGVAETGAKGVKFKIGGRMSRNLDATPGRTEAVVTLGRKLLGDGMILYADANGSYDVKEAIRVGRMLDELDYKFFEEPCPWENLSETQAVARALDIPIAAGEQDSSLWRFQWMLDNDVMKIVQPDINYNGGIIRAKRVARMAEVSGRTIVPHNTQTGVASCHILQFASCTPNAVPYMEYPWRKPRETPDWFTPDFKIVDGRIKVPKGPGMGIEVDPSVISRADILATVTGRVGKIGW